MLLATVVAKQDAAEDVDFLPLTVDYREKFYSVGRFPGGFYKRETKPSDYEVLTARLVDRASEAKQKRLVHRTCTLQTHW